MKRLLAACGVAGALLALQVSPASASAYAYPNSIASTGDSITRAFDSTVWGCLLADCPQYSWSTGTSSSVNSQYRRLLALNPGISGHVYNDAKTGANMYALDGQLKTAASQNVDYVTVLMGANDVCTSSISAMTPTATFQAEFSTALSDLYASHPNMHVYVSSLPNIYQLWSVLHTNSSAQWAWRTYGICQSMLSSSNTEAQRQQVVAQEAADNQVLQSVCAQYPGSFCRWDNYAGYNFNFPASDVSTIDYFHPNIAGQNAVANVTWAASFWGS